MRLHLVATVAMTLLYGIPAVFLLTGDPHFMSELAALGYPAYFATLLGLSKLAALAVILLPGLPRLKEWAYAGLVIDAAAAVASRLMAGGDPLLVLPAVAIGAVALASWATRPMTRRLADTAVA